MDGLTYDYDADIRSETGEKDQSGLPSNSGSGMLRQGVVVKVGPAPFRCVVTIDGSSVEIPEVEYMAHCSPSVEDRVWIVPLGGDYVIVGVRQANQSLTGAVVP